MATSTFVQFSTPKDNVRQTLAKLDTLPPEIRSSIYSYLGHDTWLEVTFFGHLRVTDHLMSLGAISRSLRNEILPILRGNSPTYRPILVSTYGRFPDNIRRRIPNRVLHSIRIIIITGDIRYDEIKPSLTTFSSLTELRFDLYSIIAPSWLMDKWESLDWNLNTREILFSETESKSLIADVKRDTIMSRLEELHQAQERPREGLERDYLVEGTLHQVLSMSRQRRGFEVTVEGRVFEDNDIGPYSTAGELAWIDIDSWDEDIGTVTWAFRVRAEGRRSGHNLAAHSRSCFQARKVLTGMHRSS